jgi:hypothetical protein
MSQQEVATKSNLSGIKSKVRHYRSLKLNWHIIAGLNLTTNVNLLKEKYFLIFSASDKNEIEVLIKELANIRKKPKLFSVKNSIVVGLILRLNLEKSEKLNVVDRLYLNVLLRKLPLNSRLLLSSIPNISNQKYLFLNGKPRETRAEFVNNYTRFEIDFSNLETIESDHILTSKGLIIDSESKIRITDPSVKRNSFSNAGLHDFILRDPIDTNFAYIATDKFEKIKRLDGDYLYLASRCSSNYWHFLLEDAVRLCNYKIKNPLKSFDGILVSHDLIYKAREVIALFYPDTKLIAIRSDECFVVNSGQVPKSRLTLQDEPIFGISEIFDLVIEQVESFTKSVLRTLSFHDYPKSSKIYVRRSSTHRVIIGEEFLIKELSLLGFSILDLNFLSFEEQVMYFSNADIIIGLAGAAWANLIFAKQSVAVVSLVGEDAAPWDMHQVIATKLGLNYRQFRINSDDKTDFFYTNFLHRDLVLHGSIIEELIKLIVSLENS